MSLYHLNRPAQASLAKVHRLKKWCNNSVSLHHLSNRSKCIIFETCSKLFENSDEIICIDCMIFWICSKLFENSDTIICFDCIIFWTGINLFERIDNSDAIICFDCIIFKTCSKHCSRQKLKTKQKQVTCFTLKCLKKEFIERFWIRFESCFCWFLSWKF